MVGTQTDITAQREREQAASQAAARLERIAMHVPGILYQFELDADFVPRFPYLSERARTLLGLDPARAAVNAAELMDRIDAADREAVTASIIESAHRLSLWQWEFRVHAAPDGAALDARPPRRRRAAADGSTVWHGYMQDVTELRELERARQDKAAAEAANRAKTEFLSRMSHELRTPLNAVLGFSQLLEIDRADSLSEGQRRRVKLIREAGEHLLRMIGDLLDLTRIESGSLQVQIDAVPMRALAEEAVDMLRPQAESAQVRVTLQIKGASPGCARRPHALAPGAAEPAVQRHQVQPRRRQRGPAHRAGAAGRRPCLPVDPACRTPAWASTPPTCRTCSSPSTAWRRRAAASKVPASG